MQRRLPILLAVAVVLLVAVAVRFGCAGRGSSGPLPETVEGLLDRIDEIRQQGAAADSRVLVKLTEHPETAVARAAMNALAETDPQTARTVLDGQLRGSPGVARRAAAAAALGRLKTGNPATLVATLSSEPDAKVRAAAARALARYSGPRRRGVLPALVAALRDPDPEVRRWALRGIHRVSVQRFFFQPDKPPQSQEARIRFIEKRLRDLGLL